MGYTVGFMKPIGTVPVKTGKDVYDADALFIKETLGLDEPLEVISPFVQTYENQTLLFQGKIKDAQKDVLAAFKSLKKKDFVIVCGGGDLFDGSLLGHRCALAPAAHMKAHAPHGRALAGRIFGRRALRRSHASWATASCGGVLNKMPVNAWWTMSRRRSSRSWKRRA